jgi:hypothetical protein
VRYRELVLEGEPELATEEVEHAWASYSSTKKKKSKKGRRVTSLGFS